jgi:hypothetical protein
LLAERPDNPTLVVGVLTTIPQQELSMHPQKESCQRICNRRIIFSNLPQTAARPRMPRLIQINEAMNTGRNAGRQARLVPKSSGGRRNTLFRQPWKESNHVTSNDLLVGCFGHHRHRLHRHDFN